MPSASPSSPEASRRMARVNLLIADDVGLGKTIKTIEAGLVIQELLLRHRARTVLIVCLLEPHAGSVESLRASPRGRLVGWVVR